MSALAIHHRPHLPTRVVAAFVLGALVLVGAVGVATRLGDGDGGTAVSTHGPPVAPNDAVEGWLAANRDAVFPGAAGGYLGTCPVDAPAFTVGLCSALVEDLGDVQIHLVGAYATDWGADLLLERDAAGDWAVTGVAPWPELGTRHDGPPWSPLTPITAWWIERGAVHLRSCADGAGVATGQALVCSTLVTSTDGERVYDTGPVGQAPEVRITVVEGADHTWRVAGAIER